MRLLDVLGLKVRIAEEGAEGEARQSEVDLEVTLLGDGPLPAEVLELPERRSYTDPETDEHGAPIIQVWERIRLRPGSTGANRFYRLRYWDASEFLVDKAGARVWARWPAVVPRAEVMMCLLGPIIGFVLHLRGTPCLHASAVAVNGRAVAFLGHSGAGKSTTAAAFVRRGFRALTDDVLALDERKDSGVRIQESEAGSQNHDIAESRIPNPESFHVRPGHNLVRLWPDAVRALYGSDEALPHGGDTTDKRHLDLVGQDNAFQAEALPLAAIYVLGDRVPGLEAPASIIDLTGHQALMALVARTYMNYVLDVDLRVRALTVFARLAAQVPIRQLTVRHDAGALGELTDAILSDLASLDRRL